MDVQLAGQKVVLTVAMSAFYWVAVKVLSMAAKMVDDSAAVKVSKRVALMDLEMVCMLAQYMVGEKDYMSAVLMAA